MALVQKEIKKVYLGSTQIRPVWWQPWANTICYFPLDTDLNDTSGNWYSLTGNNWAVIGNLNGLNCLDLTSNHSYASWVISWIPQWNQVRTNIFWIRWNFIEWGYSGYTYGQSGSGKADTIYYNSPITWSQYWNAIDTWVTPTAWDWVHIAVTIDGSTSQKVYVNWTLKNSWSLTMNTDGTTLYLWHNPRDWTYANWYISKFIIENRVRTAQEVADYFNQTKADYWIS